MKIPPALDVHSHVAPGIEAREIRLLGAFLFAMTRSPAEFAQANERVDSRTIWGLGIHPGLVRVLKSFDASEFESALGSTVLVGEVGLDGKSRVPMETQQKVFRSILEVLQRNPRIVSLHSSGAHIQVIRALHRTPVEGVILHWWTGSRELTEEAVRLGCYFSLPPALMSSLDILDVVPLERLLPETDHPYGDRLTPGQARPGGVGEVERRVAVHYGMKPLDLRLQFWRNLKRLADEGEVSARLGSEWQSVFRELD